MEEGSFAYHAAIQNYALVVRGISTAYNYGKRRMRR